MTPWLDDGDARALPISAWKDCIRFFQLVEHGPGKCWTWIGDVSHNGYGRFRLNGQVVQAHVAAYEALIGPIADGLEPDHLCRNRACVNPSHIEPVTHAENCRRGWQSNGHRRSPTCPSGHEFTPDNTYRDPKTGYRACRACLAARARLRRKRRRGLVS